MLHPFVCEFKYIRVTEPEVGYYEAYRFRVFHFYCGMQRTHVVIVEHRSQEIRAPELGLFLQQLHLQLKLARPVYN